MKNSRRAAGGVSSGGAVSVSNRQYCLLRDLRQQGFRLEKVLGLSQVTTGSLVRRGLLIWNPRRELLELTAQGEQVLTRYSSTDITRKNERAPLSKYLTGNRTIRRGGTIGIRTMSKSAA